MKNSLNDLAGEIPAGEGRKKEKYSCAMEK